MGRFFEEFWVSLRLLLKTISESGLVRGLELAALAQWVWEYWYISAGAALLATLIFTSATSAPKKK